MLEHLLKIADTTGVMPQAVLDGQIPDSLSYLVLYFDQIQRQRQAGFSGVSRMSFLEIESWARLTGVSLTPFELSVLQDLDAAHCAELEAQMSKDLK